MEFDISIVYAAVVAAFFIAILIDIPVALAIAAAGLVGIVMLEGFEIATYTLSSVFFSSAAIYSLFVIPMYVLLGALMSNAGIGERIYRTVERGIAWMPGGLGATAVGATCLFSGISGSSAADTATFGRLSVNEMSRYGYKKEYAAAVVAAAGTYASLIPPSVGIVIYCVIAELSIGKMIITAIVPGVLSAIVLILFVVVRAMITPYTAGYGAKPPKVMDSSTGNVVKPKRGSLLHDLSGALYAVVIFAIVVGGLYGGMFTPSEAGAVGAFAAMMIAFFAKPKGVGMKFLIQRSVLETSEFTSMIFMLLIGGAILSSFVSISGLASSMVEWTTSLPVSPKFIVACILLLLLPMGMVLDGLSMTLLVVPLTAPLVLELGFDGYWYGILVLKMIEVGLITPPVGMNVFIVSGLTGVPSSRVFRYVSIFVALDLTITALLFAFPELILWLPRMMGY